MNPLNTTPAYHTSAAMQGFHAEFKNLDDYIRVITDRIWEGRQIETIRDYYSDPCGVITPAGATTDVQSVIDGTKATLAQFPDRRLLAEDVIEAGDAQTGFLSSHRIISTMTHLGDGNFGKATGKKIHVRTVADCVCKDNRIVHEWLVRDQGAIALAVGSTPQEMAKQWLAARSKPLLPQRLSAAPIWWRNPMSNSPVAQSYAVSVGQMLTGKAVDITLYDEAACHMGPVNSTHYGRQEIQGFYASIARSISASSYEIESITFMPASSSAGRPPRVALRWRLKGQHTGVGRYSAEARNQLDILGINHAEFVKINNTWQVHREWVLIDDVAVWMQVLDNTASQK
ncbi:ester cyclase [Variovorax sp. PCZ-1]|uniref:ester cyclase n=1 Tax=Variovorax sp. PCZ-1 TaxID=2835533 RepID=UPI001BCF5045|nr:ester cyclase [Variovorax sp. PCZ-1]MBS7807906.1 ester cyclase [Variovorax sp. PCZ-1]